MKLFKCRNCGQLLYFENNRCESCGYALGFHDQTLELYPLENKGENVFTIFGAGDSALYKYCANFDHKVCNWLVKEGSPTPFCRACELNQTIPNLSKQEYIARWNVLEKAKHRLIYSLLRFKLPLVSKTSDPENGLSFDFIADEHTGSNQRVLTGHDNGLITINIAEADDIEREMARKAMDELYRTVLGHFRHEVGHYYWDRLIDNSKYQDEYRQLFGDEREDYGKALQVHYEQGPPPDWNQSFISAYATTHSWEDWAETWAHYLHIIDTLETAYAFGLKVQPKVLQDSSLKAEMVVDPYKEADFDSIMSRWLPLTLAMNSMNRSMGLHDLYPFVIYPKVTEKLRFIHKVCYATGHE